MNNFQQSKRVIKEQLLHIDRRQGKILSPNFDLIPDDFLGKSQGFPLLSNNNSDNNFLKKEFALHFDNLSICSNGKNCHNNTNENNKFIYFPTFNGPNICDPGYFGTKYSPIVAHKKLLNLLEYLANHGDEQKEICCDFSFPIDNAKNEIEGRIFNITNGNGAGFRLAVYTCDSSDENFSSMISCKRTDGDGFVYAIFEGRLIDEFKHDHNSSLSIPIMDFDELSDDSLLYQSPSPSFEDDKIQLPSIDYNLTLNFDENKINDDDDDGVLTFYEDAINKNGNKFVEEIRSGSMRLACLSIDELEKLVCCNDNEKDMKENILSEIDTSYDPYQVRNLLIVFEKLLSSEKLKWSLCEEDVDKIKRTASSWNSNSGKSRIISGSKNGSNLTFTFGRSQQIYIICQTCLKYNDGH